MLPINDTFGLLSLNYGSRKRKGNVYFGNFIDQYIIWHWTLGNAIVSPFTKLMIRGFCGPMWKPHATTPRGRSSFTYVISYIFKWLKGI